MAPTSFDFDKFRTEFAILVRTLLQDNDLTPLVNKIQAISTPFCEADVKTTVDQAFRDILAELIVSKANRQTLEKLINLSIECAIKDICAASLPVMLLSDVFDCMTLDVCEELFDFVEHRVDTWKEELFFKNCKNQLLRSCNDLLRRLSRSQNTVFCGRILVFLARFFPLSERSGLNIISEFNLDNITHFSPKDDSCLVEVATDKDDSMEEGEMDDNAPPMTVDYNLYRKFWSIQEFFRQPNACYNKVKWRQFSVYSADVLSAFGSFKLDDVKSTKWKLSEAAPSSSDRPVYFAKYLTSQKLLELELSDSNFRRYVLVQFLILFQYLQSSVKFKQDSQVLSDEQNTWIQDTTERIYKLLAETPPDGAAFAKHIEHILKREEYWNNWKNDGCPDFKDVDEAKKTPMKPTKMKRKLGDEVRAASNANKVLLGNAEMNRLWNLCPDNWEACKSKRRNFVPSLESFFEPAIEQADPNAQIESKFKCVNNSNYGWRALRLLSQKSPHFFTHSNQPIKSLPVYLESMVLKVAKELPYHHHPQQQQNQAPSVDEKQQDMSATPDSEDELLKNSEDNAKAMKDDDKSSNKDTNLVTMPMLQSLASRLQANWKVLAPKLGFQEDEVLYYSTQKNDPSLQGALMLQVWMEQEAENATIEALQLALEAAGLEKYSLNLETSVPVARTKTK